MNTEYFDKFSLSIEKEISVGILNIEPEEDGSKFWTDSINESLCKIAKANGRNHLVATSRAQERDNREWLYDLVWYEDNEHQVLSDVHLVVECEWKNPFTTDYFMDVKYDFEKLILARSNRLMIFEVDLLEQGEDYIADLNDIVKNCKLSKKSDRYMYAVWIKKNRDFLFDLYIHE